MIWDSQGPREALTNCCSITGAWSKAAPSGAFQKPVATLACCFVPEGLTVPWCPKPGPAALDTEPRAPQGYSTFPSEVSKALDWLLPRTSVGSLPSAGFLQAHPGSRKAAPAILAPWLHLSMPGQLWGLCCKEPGHHLFWSCRRNGNITVIAPTH